MPQAGKASKQCGQLSFLFNFVETLGLLIIAPRSGGDEAGSCSVYVEYLKGPDTYIYVFKVSLWASFGLLAAATHELTTSSAMGRSRNKSPWIPHVPLMSGKQNLSAA
jgi:hypothetical protein